jgi:VWFA-related protein
MFDLPCLSRSNTRLFWTLPLFATLMIPALAAQAPTPGDQTASPLTTDNFHLTVKSQLVVLDTVVTDRKGNIVSNLTRDDFQIYEDGVPQKIRSFEAPANLPPIPDKPVKDHNGNDDWGQSPLTMIVVDELNTPFMEISYAKQCVEAYLKAQPTQLIEPTILLWLNDSGLRPVTTFTRDRDAILTAILKHPPSSASKLARGAAVEQIAASFSALQQAALFSRGQPGKKEILWVGKSFPGLNGQNMEYADKELMTKALHSTINLLLASRVSLYVIDPTLSTSVDFNNPDAITDTAAIEPLPAPKAPDPFANSFNIGLFVDETGGKYYRGANNLDREIADSVHRGVEFYTLTYTPALRESPSEYHSITLRMRDPNLLARTKEGYYSTEPVNPEKPSQAAREADNDLRFDLYEATITGIPYTGIGLHVTQCQRTHTEQQATCNISIDSGTLTFNANDKGQEQTAILAVISSLDAKGHILNHTTRQLTLGIPENQANLIRTGNMLLALHTVVPTGTKRIRVVLRDVSGRIGTAEVDPAQVPMLVSSVVMKKGIK